MGFVRQGGNTLTMRYTTDSEDDGDWLVDERTSASRRYRGSIRKWRSHIDVSRQAGTNARQSGKDDDARVYCDIEVLAKQVFIMLAYGVLRDDQVLAYAVCGHSGFMIRILCLL